MIKCITVPMKTTYKYTTVTGSNATIRMYMALSITKPGTTENSIRWPGYGIHRNPPLEYIPQVENIKKHASETNKTNTLQSTTPSSVPPTP